MNDRLCTTCHHFHFDLGHPAWSETTPGDSPEIYCTVGHFDLPRHANSADLHRAVIRAGDCPDYEDDPNA